MWEAKLFVNSLCFQLKKPLFISGSYIFLILAYLLFGFGFFFCFVLFFSAHSTDSSSHKVQDN